MVGNRRCAALARVGHLSDGAGIAYWCRCKSIVSIGLSNLGFCGQLFFLLWGSLRRKEEVEEYQQTTVIEGDK